MEGVASNNGRGSNDGGSDQAAAAAATATATATATKDKDTDEFLSDELFKMNLEDRETIHEEIHGVRCAAPDESAAFLESSLEEFEKALGALPSHKTSSYRRCLAAARQRQQKQQQQKQQQQQQHNYAVHDRDFRLRFLRCELFDAPRAALRFANYLSFVNDLWGPVALEREIRFSDFTTEEAKIFRKGYYQLLPVRDQSGRRVIVFLGGMGFSPDTNERARAKILFYLWNSVTLGDVESQRKGAVVVVDITCWKGITIQNASPPRDSREVMVRSFAAIPTRIAAMHVCLPDRPFSRIVKSLIALDATGRSQRQRIRFHLQEEGSGHLYVRYRLKGYGIPVELVPMTESGTITTKHHSQWLKTRHLFEGGGMAGSVGGGGGGTKPNTFPEPVDCPRSNDVLFRQGKDMMEHPGNKMFRDLILSSLAHQEALKKRMRPSSLPNPETENNRSDPNREASPAAEATPTATPLETLFAPGAANHANDDATASALAFGKHRFVNSWILDEILDRRGGRFLEWDRRNTVWYVMTDIPTIKNKISVVYSKYRKRSEAASKNNNNNRQNNRQNNSKRSSGHDRRQQQQQQRQKKHYSEAAYDANRNTNTFSDANANANRDRATERSPPIDSRSLCFLGGGGGGGNESDSSSGTIPYRFLEGGTRIHAEMRSPNRCFGFVPCGFALGHTLDDNNNNNIFGSTERSAAAAAAAASGSGGGGLARPVRSVTNRKRPRNGGGDGDDDIII